MTTIMSMSMTMISFNDNLLLLQLNDTQFPIGSYSHSYGLETYIQDRTIHNEEGTQKYLFNFLRGTFLYNDLFAAHRAFIATKEENLEEIINLNIRLRASKSQLELREASEKLGSRFIHTLKEMDLELGSFFNEVIEIHKKKDVNIHHSVAYGLITSLLGIDRKLSLSSYAFNTSAGMTSNAVKMIPISQFSGQRILNETRAIILELVEKVETLDLEDFGVSFPGVEIASMRHENLYSRLYMS